MRAALPISAPLLFALAVSAAPALVSQENKPQPKAPQEKERVHSKLYRDFDPGSLEKKCWPHYDRPFGISARTGFQFGSSPDHYKLFDITGNISEAKLKQLLAELKIDLHKMAKASEVETVSEPSDKFEDRPISVLRSMYLLRKIVPGTAHGFYLTYRDGKITGAIDVLAALSSDPKENYWEVVCAVHEVVPEEYQRVPPAK